MNVLEDWIINLLTKPIEDFDDKYRDEDDVKEELAALSLPEKNGPSSYVSSEVLYKLHQKIRGYSCEYAIWECVLWFLAHPLPISVAHDLIDRNKATVMMGHRRQVDEVQWRLATFHEDALYTLIVERYQEPKFSTDQFQKILETYQSSIWYEGILQILPSHRPESNEKEAVFLAALEKEKERISERQHQHDSDSSSNHLEDD